MNTHDAIVRLRELTNNHEDREALRCALVEAALWGAAGRASSDVAWEIADSIAPAIPAPPTLREVRYGTHTFTVRDGKVCENGDVWRSAVWAAYAITGVDAEDALVRALLDLLDHPHCDGERPDVVTVPVPVTATEDA